MDRNSIIGLLLIGAIIIGYTMYTQPSQQEIDALKHKRDSVEAVMKEQQKMEQQAAKATVPVASDTTIALSDSAKMESAKQQLGDFASASSGKEDSFAFENDLLKVTVSSRGGIVKAVELKKYKNAEGKPVVLMNGDSSIFNLSFPAANRTINSTELYFTSSGVVTKGTVKSISLRLNAGENKYVEYLYSITEGSYLVSFKVNVVGLNDIISSNATYLAFDWKESIKPQEKSIETERTNTTIYYSFPGEEVDNISYGKDEQTSLKTKVKWISFKQQFFTSVLIADEAFDSPIIQTQSNPNSKTTVKTLTASFSIPYNHKPSESYAMQFYFGPNHYQTLKKVGTGDLHLEQQIKLGWGIFGWVNRYAVIPIFNFLNSFNLNFGLIILLLTVMIRIVILPLTYGSYKSQAKIKVLQPELKEINEKYPDDAMKKQQETMALYKKAGVNPLGGCIPGLLQMPILIAMFNFFPTSIELRQQSFLWAHDLSTYDSILDLGFKIPFYGDHVSLFTLLMTVSTLLFTKINMQMTSAANPQMKWMMYLMPIMFLGMFNSYSAGLSYYYFLSNIFGLLQQYMFKFVIDEDAIHRQIQENKKKTPKKSGFQARLEQMAKQRGYPVKK